jgi:hypothetical protein
MCRGLAALLAASTVCAADLTATESRWLRGVWPVVAHAREAKLALDIVVQPQPTPGAAPRALAFVDAVPEALGPELQTAWADMQSARREEAYGDLVGLAWVRLARDGFAPGAVSIFAAAAALWPAGVVAGE